MFSIDLTSRTPIYKQLENHIIQYISCGVLAAHEQLPSVRSLAQELRINPNTVQKVYALLEQKGLIYTASGRGAFVADATSSVQTIQALAKQQLKEKAKEAMETGITMEEQIKIIRANFEEGSK